MRNDGTKPKLSPRRSILICGLLPKGIESANPGYQLWPWGLCHLVVRVADNKVKRICRL